MKIFSSESNIWPLKKKMNSKEENSTISVNINMPPLKPVKLQVTPPTPQTINLLFRCHPDLVFITNYDLISKSGSIFSEHFDIQKDKDAKTGDITLNVQNLPYTEQSALEHAQLFARICFAHSLLRQTTDCNQSVVGWITRNYDSNSKASINIDINDLNGIFPEKYQNSSLPLIIKYIDLSNSPLSAKELLQGCILKLTVTTIEEKTYTVYANKNGWFTNLNSTVFSTLHLLLCTLSKFYSDNYFLISDKWCKLRSAERQPYYSTYQISDRTFVERITDENGHLIDNNRLRLFNKKIDTSSLSNMTLDDLIDEAKAAGEKESFINQLELQYVMKSIDAVSSIENGSLAPFCGSSSYLYQDLFISRIEALTEANKDKGGFDTANRVINNEIQAYSQISSLSQSASEKSEPYSPSPYRFVKPICVDFFTNRFIGQTCIPGLVVHRSPIVYGYVPSEDPKHKEFNNDKEVVEIIKNDMVRLGIGASRIHGTKEPIYTSSETTAVSSTDGFLYISDYKRVTPRDANYSDPIKHHGCIIRPEAVTSFTNFNALEKHSKELIDLGGDKENLYHFNTKTATENDSEKIQKLEQRRTEIIEQAEKPTFDINALTVDSEKDSSLNSKSFPQNVKDIAKFVVDYLIPKFIQEYVEQSSFIVDGKTIVHQMHSRGINARYLGRILDLLLQKDESKLPMKEHFCLSLEAEIIARSFKYIKRKEMASIESVINDLNLLVGLKKSEENFSVLFDNLVKVAFEKFGTKNLKQPKPCQRFLIIRSVLSSFGVLLRSFKDVEHHQISIDDISEITPLVKFPFTRNARFNAAVEIATSIFSQEGASNQALSLFNVALQIANADDIDPFDQGVAICYFYMSLIYDQQGECENAFNSCLTSTIIQERLSDQLAPEIIIRYSLLARYAKLTNRNKLAFAFADRAANLGRLFAPNHPWVGIEYTVACDLAIEISPEFSVQYGEEKLKYLQELAAKSGNNDALNKQMAKIYQSLSKALLQDKKLNEALEKVQKALELDPQNEEIKGAFELIKSQLN